MKTLVLLAILFSGGAHADEATQTPTAASTEPRCRFATKDYTSPGFATMKRQGLHIVGRFGCDYICSCDGKTWRVAAVLSESHFDADFFSKDPTGGPDRAKWFICENSVKSWTKVTDPLYDWVTLYWDAEPQDSPLPISQYVAPEIHDWAEHSCKK